MRLIVHAGLHKTGSTYLQQIMNDNHEELLGAGVYYEHQPGYPAHHFAAWDLLRGDPSKMVRMLHAARRANCHTVIFSSEDLEGLIFDPGSAAILESAATEAGAERVEWHMCLRDPGEYFCSLYSQLQHHVFADPATMLYDTLRSGMIMFLDPLRGAEGTPFWCYCFDYTHCLAFADRTVHSVFVHDFRDASPYPGWGILDSAGVLQAIRKLPGAEARNARLSRSQVLDGYAERIGQQLGTEAQRAIILPRIREQVRRNLASIDMYGNVVSERFADGMTAALNKLGYVPREGSTRMATAA